MPAFLITMFFASVDTGVMLMVLVLTTAPMSLGIALIVKAIVNPEFIECIQPTQPILARFLRRIIPITIMFLYTIVAIYAAISVIRSDGTGPLYFAGVIVAVAVALITISSLLMLLLKDGKNNTGSKSSKSVPAPPGSKWCSKCGGLIDASIKFCPQCGGKQDK